MVWLTVLLSCCLVVYVRAPKNGLLPSETYFAWQPLKPRAKIVAGVSALVLLLITAQGFGQLLNTETSSQGLVTLILAFVCLVQVVWIVVGRTKRWLPPFSYKQAAVSAGMPAEMPFPGNR